MKAAELKTLRGAIAHIVIWQLNGESAVERSRQAQRIVEAFRALEKQVPGLLNMEVGANQVDAADAWDLGLYLVFESKAALQAYQSNAAHKSIKDLVATMRVSRAQVDFELFPQRA